MGIRRAVTMATVGAASAASLVLSAGAASADTNGTPVWKDGVWRAYGQYTSETRTLCVRGYNNFDTASVSSNLITPSYRKGVGTRGNGSFCSQIDRTHDFWSGRLVTLEVSHVSAGGETTSAQIAVRL